MRIEEKALEVRGVEEEGRGVMKVGAGDVGG